MNNPWLQEQYRLLYVFFNFPQKREKHCNMMFVCLSVCLSVCLCLVVYLKKCMSKLHKIFCIFDQWPQLSSFLMTVRNVLCTYSIVY